MLGRTDLEASTCWDFPTQSDGHSKAGDATFNGVTPARCAENLVRRYARPGDLVVDPMAGSGTIGDVARSLGRRAISFDLTPKRSDILRADARAWPIPDGMAALAVIDSPYSDNLAYGRDPRCLGRIIADEYRGGFYTPAGFRLLNVLTELFEPVDTVVLVRHHDRSASPMWEHRARRFNFYLRGFKYLFILRKPVGTSGG